MSQKEDAANTSTSWGTADLHPMETFLASLDIKNPSAKRCKLGIVQYSTVLSWRLAIKLQRDVFLLLLFPHFNK